MRVAGLLKAKGTDVHTVDPGVSLRDAALLMRSLNIGCLVVSTADRDFIGTLTERDLISAIAAHGGGATLRVSDVMQCDVPGCTLADTLENLMTTMTDNRTRHLPVFDEGKLVGVVSIGDVVKRRLQELEQESRLIQEYASWAW